MCSVVRCDSFLRSAPRFKLPEDPEDRLQWVQFVLEVNEQRLKESSWTDISVCREHFAPDCFVNPISSGEIQLKPGALPSLGLRPEPDKHLESPRVEPVETAASSPEKSQHTLTDAVSAGSGQTQQKDLTTQPDKKLATPPKTKGKYVVNEKRLLELFGRKCPSCGCKLQTEKVTYGELVVFNQRCFKCDYSNQWKSQVNATVPPADNRHPKGGAEVTSEIQQAVPTDDNPGKAVLSEIVTFSDEESDSSDDEEECHDVWESSDSEWNPPEDSEEDEDNDLDSTCGLKINELCTDCGRFFSIQKPHVCEHKIKPYSCNICGKRCATEISLKVHSKIHDETYEYPCKYCYVTFRTRVDKLKHEDTHKYKKNPYKCPDCPETFDTSKKRRTHLAKHRGPNRLLCGVCGIEFFQVNHLQRHSVVHTGLKPYKCSVCQRGFSQSTHLKSHMRVHTGERPYKCQHCDESFNHNVSLKSHIQRYHSSSSGPEQKRGKVDKTANNAGDTEDNGNEKDTDSESDNLEEEDTKEEEPKGRADRPKNQYKRSGRPRGRPKRKAVGNLVLAGETEDERLNTKTAKSKSQKLKKTGSADEASEEEQSGSDVSFHSAEEEERKEEEEMTRKSARSSRRSTKDDSDFNPEEETKKKRRVSESSGESSGESLAKRRGRPTEKSLNT